MTGEQITAPVETEATKLISRVVLGYGSGTLSCDCGGHEVWIDGSTATAHDVQMVGRLIEHARYDHVTPRAVLVHRAPEVLVDYSTEARQGVGA